MNTISKSLLLFFFIITGCASRPLKAKITLMDNTVISGVIFKLDEMAIDLLVVHNHTEGEITSIPVTNIKQVVLRKKNSIRHGFAIGLGFGFVSGAILGVAAWLSGGFYADSNPGKLASIGALVVGASGGLIGGSIGAIPIVFHINGDPSAYGKMKRSFDH